MFAIDSTRSKMKGGEILSLVGKAGKGMYNAVEIRDVLVYILQFVY
jgi:hypothetical protein